MLILRTCGVGFVFRRACTWLSSFIILRLMPYLCHRQLVFGCDLAAMVGGESAYCKTAILSSFPWGFCPTVCFWLLLCVVFYYQSNCPLKLNEPQSRKLWTTIPVSSKFHPKTNKTWKSTPGYLETIFLCFFFLFSINKEYQTRF